MAPKKANKNQGSASMEVSKPKIGKPKKDPVKSPSKNELTLIKLENVGVPLTRGVLKRIIQKDIMEASSSKQVNPVKLMTDERKRTRDKSSQTTQKVDAVVDPAMELENSETQIRTNDKRKRKADVRSAEINKKLRSRANLETLPEINNTDEHTIQTTSSEPVAPLLVTKVDVYELCEEESCAIDVLPSEVLTEIFTYLPFRDLKSARMVCQRWYDAANVMQFLLDEKLLCYALYELNVIIETLKNTKRKTLNLEFYDITFENYEITFWEKCSQKIGSLLFSDCTLPDETIEKIIVHCDKLENLSLEYMPGQIIGKKFCSEDMLLRLIENGVVRKNLTFLDLNMLESDWMSNNLMNSLFTIFPGIRKFVFSCDTVEDDFNDGDVEDEELLHSRTTCTFSSILKKLTDSADTLDELAVDVGEYHSRDAVPAAAVCEGIMPLTFTRLADIKLDIDLVSMPRSRVIEFFARHKKLESVECQILNEETLEFTSQLLVCLLDNCPNLRYLQIIQDILGYPTVDINPSLFIKLANSRLEFLSLNFCLNITPPDVLPVNNTLLSLSLFSAIGTDVHSIFYQTFRNLKHLEVSGIDDATLSLLFKYQTELTSLKLIDCRNCSDYGFTGRNADDTVRSATDCSIRRLKKLEYFEFKTYAPFSTITDCTVSEFVFPNLKYLHITIEGYWKFHTALVNILHTFPLLEGIFFQSDDTVEYNNWLLLCANLKRLRYLHIDNKEDSAILRDEAYELMFDMCPSLRAFKHRNYCSYMSYYYDTVQKKIAKKTAEREQYRISAENIDTFTVNWMWF